VNTTVRESFATGSVTGEVDVGALVGGQYEGGLVADSYAAATVTAEADYGLLVGWVEGTVERSYASGMSDPAMLVALCWYCQEASVESSFFDCEVAGSCSSTGGTSTAAMSSLTTYTNTGWNFDETWGFLAPSGYPCLIWQNGCGCIAGRDSDSDGSEDCTDDCVADPTKTTPGVCGCGHPDVDSDGDGPLDCDDACPFDPAKALPGACGCNEPDVDADNDGSLNCNDPDWPHAIRDCAELQAIRETPESLAGAYRLVLDVDCTDFDAGDGQGFQPIGEEGAPGPFTGSIDGNGHVITGLTIARPGWSKVGLFGATEGALVERVGLVDVSIDGGDQVGALVGHATDTIIRESFASGSVVGAIDVGGLVGFHGADSTISDSYASVSVDGEADEGLLAGWVEGMVERSYASGTGDPAALGVLSDGSFDACFFDCTVAGNCSAEGGTSTAAMTSEATYTTAGWNFTTTWSFFNIGGYPCLRSQENCGDETCAPTDPTCNGQDDDCDGLIDDDFASQATSCGTGACARTGATTCLSGSVHNSCLPGPISSDANCDAVDDDCDGAADDNYASQASSCGTGVCARTGNTSCVAGQVQSNCTPGSPTGSDASCDGLNDDCDAFTDEAYAGSSTTCTVNGCAAAGVLLCQSGEVVDTCPTAPQCYAEVACVDGNDNDGDGQTDCADADCTGCTGGGEVCGNSLDDDADGLPDCADLDCDGIGPCVRQAPIAEEAAPPLAPRTTEDFADQVAFLFTGPDPVQRGVTPGTLAPVRLAVVSGRALSPTGAPLPGVLVRVLAHSELGRTYSAQDGSFVLAVNGGGPLTLTFEKQGLLSAQRNVITPWKDYVVVADVTLLAPDAQVTTVTLGSSAPLQVARGSVASDSDGTRQATVLFPAAVEAQLELASGTRIPITTLSVRATEYTVGEHGPSSMPASLPPETAYTYAVELSVDEAIQAGARQ
jgi:hypothetical protein